MRKILTLLCLVSVGATSVGTAGARKHSKYPPKSLVVRLLKDQFQDSSNTIKVLVVQFRRVVHFRPPTSDYPTGTAYAVHTVYDQHHETIAFNSNHMSHKVIEVAHWKVNFLLTRTVSNNWVLRIQGYDCTSPDRICPAPHGLDGGA